MTSGDALGSQLSSTGCTEGAGDDGGEGAGGGDGTGNGGGVGVGAVRWRLTDVGLGWRAATRIQDRTREHRKGKECGA